MVIHVGERRRMSGFDRARDRLVNQLPRASDVAEAPSRESKISGRHDSRVGPSGIWLRDLARDRRFAASVRNAPAPARNRHRRGESIQRRCATPASVGRASRSASRRKLSAASRADPNSPRKNCAPTERNRRRAAPRHRRSPSQALQRARRRLSFPRRRSLWTTKGPVRTWSAISAVAPAGLLPLLPSRPPRAPRTARSPQRSPETPGSAKSLQCRPKDVVRVDRAAGGVV